MGFFESNKEVSWNLLAVFRGLQTSFGCLGVDKKTNSGKFLCTTRCCDKSVSRLFKMLFYNNQCQHKYRTMLNNRIASLFCFVLFVEKYHARNWRKWLSLGKQWLDKMLNVFLTYTSIRRELDFLKVLHDLWILSANGNILEVENNTKYRESFVKLHTIHPQMLS